MRIVVTGATGNVGTSLLRALGADDAVTSILGLARRRPQAVFAKTEFASADVTRDKLVPLFRDADCVIHLAWLIQPSHDQQELRRTNVDGSQRVLDAVAAAEVPRLVVASSVGAYSPRSDDRPVDESWPR
jgi:UDP-glucose 4-epimerase